MIEGNSFKESLGKIDLTSVGTAFVSSLLLSPGASNGAKAAVIGLTLADAAVDYSVEKKSKYVFGGKEIPEAATDVVFSFTPGISSVIGKDKYSEIGKKRYLKNGNNDAVKTATSVQ